MPHAIVPGLHVRRGPERLTIDHVGVLWGRFSSRLRRERQVGAVFREHLKHAPSLNERNLRRLRIGLEPTVVSFKMYCSARLNKERDREQVHGTRLHTVSITKVHPVLVAGGNVNDG